MPSRCKLGRGGKNKLQACAINEISAAKIYLENGNSSVSVKSTSPFLWESEILVWIFEKDMSARWDAPGIVVRPMKSPSSGMLGSTKVKKRR